MPKKTLRIGTNNKNQTKKKTGRFDNSQGKIKRSKDIKAEEKKG